MELDLLMTAIKERRLVHLLYDGRSRHIEAYALAKNSKDEDVLVGRQVQPWVPMERSWQVFRVNKIYGLLVLDREFSSPQEAAEPPAEVVADLRLAA